jgi:hypothetical protein
MIINQQRNKQGWMVRAVDAHGTTHNAQNRNTDTNPTKPTTDNITQPTSHKQTARYHQVPLV